MENCLFCKIAKGEIPANIVYENEAVIVFHDIKPAAKVHLLIVPKVHVANLLELAVREDQAEILSEVNRAIAKVSRDLGIEGFRLISNCGEDAGQTVFHLHFHLLGGQVLGARMI